MKSLRGGHKMYKLVKRMYVPLTKLVSTYSGLSQAVREGLAEGAELIRGRKYNPNLEVADLVEEN